MPPNQEENCNFDHTIDYSRIIWKIVFLLLFYDFSFTCENNVLIFQAGEFLMFGCLMLVDMALFAFLAYR